MVIGIVFVSLCVRLNKGSSLLDLQCHAFILPYKEHSVLSCTLIPTHTHTHLFLDGRVPLVILMPVLEPSVIFGIDVRALDLIDSSVGLDSTWVGVLGLELTLWQHIQLRH